MKNKKKPVEASITNAVNNGLADALLPNQSFGLGAQLSQLDTMFKNNRNYLVSNQRQLLSQVYCEHGLIQTVVNVPVDDAMRGGFHLSSKQLSEDELKELQTFQKRQADLAKFGEAMKWNRLFGGGALIIITGQDWLTPLDITKIAEGEEVSFKAVDMWELYSDRQNIDETSKLELTPDQNGFYTYYSQKIHKSRVMILKGLSAPSFVRPRLRGWGLSVVESVVRSINQYLKAADLSFEVLDEFKLDIFKIKNLSNTLLAPNGTEKIRQRVSLANSQKNYQNALTMDAEDDYMQKQLSFSGLSEVMAGIRMQVACDLRMPLTKIFGISAAGFSSGEDDIENYNAMVESEVREKAHFDLLKIAEIRCQQLFGFVPDDLSGEFKPLRVLSSEQEENVKTLKFNRLLASAML